MFCTEITTHPLGNVEMYRINNTSNGDCYDNLTVTCCSPEIRAPSYNRNAVYRQHTPDICEVKLFPFQCIYLDFILES